MSVGREWARQNWRKLALVAVASWMSVYIVLIAPTQYQRRLDEQRISGLSAVNEVNWDPQSLWHQQSWHSMLQHGSPRPVQLALTDRMAAHLSIAADEQNQVSAARKIVRTEVLELEVEDPAACLEQIRQLAERLGGYMVASAIGADSDTPGSVMTVRVPASQSQEAEAAIKRLGRRVVSEKTEAKDVTKEYVDQDAQLRNLRAAETQYLAIMKHASTVKDTLDVTDKLSDVQGEIEKHQAEFAALATQVETVAITVTLHAEADAKVFGLHWRPLFKLKSAARDGLDSLADYAATMTSALFRLPALVLWFATILFAAAIGWRIIRRAWRRFFLMPPLKS